MARETSEPDFTNIPAEACREIAFALRACARALELLAKRDEPDDDQRSKAELVVLRGGEG